MNLLVKAVKIKITKSSEMTFDKIFIKPVFGKSAYFPLLETIWRRVAELRQDLKILDSLGQVFSNTLLTGQFPWKNSMQPSNCHHYVTEVMLKKENKNQME